MYFKNHNKVLLQPRQNINPRDKHIMDLIKEFKNDPELFNEVLIELRKDKIDKIKNRYETGNNKSI